MVANFQANLTCRVMVGDAVHHSITARQVARFKPIARAAEGCESQLVIQNSFNFEDHRRFRNVI